jgi:hypothetical protein
MGGGNGGGKSTVTQDIPKEFKPAFTSLFNSAFGAARTGAGQDISQWPFAGQPAMLPVMQPGMGGLPMINRGALYGQPMQQFNPIMAGQQFGGGAVQQQPQAGLGGQPTQQAAQQPAPTDGKGGGGGQQQQFERQAAFQQGRPLRGVDNRQLGLRSDDKGGFGQLNTPLPGGFQDPGSTSIPLAAGYPIIGQPFPGPFTAPTSPLELEALMGREQVGRQLGGLGGNLLGLGQAQAGGAFLHPASNPFFTQNIQASLQPAIDAYTRSVMPQFSSQALQSGAFQGSSARDMAAATLANDFGRNLAQTAAQAGMQNFMQERMIQQQTPQLLDAAARLQQLSPEILSQVGVGERQLLQRGLDEALLQFQEQQQAPFRPLGPLANIIQGTNVGVNTTQTVPTPSALAQGIAGALGGGALGAGTADVLGLTGGRAAGATGLAALLGGLGGGLG